MSVETQASAGSPRIPAPPRSLGAPGRAEWRRLCAQYVFAPGEVALLTEFCANVDLLARLRAELDKGPMVVNSPQAGPVANRMIGEIRACQDTMRRLAELLRFRELAAAAEAAQFPALRDADVLHARPVLGPRDPRSHRRRAI